MSSSADGADMEADMDVDGDSTALPKLPEDLIFKILEWLPVKSLLQFRSVSKAWYSFISSTQFVKTHLSVSAKNTEIHRVLFCCDTIDGLNLKSCSLSSLQIPHSLQNPPSDVTYDQLHFDPYSSSSACNNFAIVGSCNGLLCLKMHVLFRYKVYLWNPSIRKCITLPYPDFRLDYNCDECYGFGYDDSSDNFKVVGVFCDCIDGAYKSQVWVYTGRGGSWRRISDMPTDRRVEKDAVLANGTLHWEASPVNSSDDSFDIISLNLRDESYGHVLQPNYADGIFYLSLGAFCGFLSVTCFCYSHLDIWIMKDYGVPQSWINHLHIKDATNAEYMMIPGISSIEENLLNCQMDAMLLNSRQKIVKNAEIRNLGVSSRRCSYFYVDTYLESLVYPVPEIERNRQLHQ